MANFTTEEIQAARTKLWQKGMLSWKLEAPQKDLYNFFKDTSEQIVVWNASRRLGKSYALLILALEECIQNDGAVVKYVTPQKNMAKTIIRPIMREILADAPPEVRPEFKTNAGTYEFPNGSEIQLAGTDGGHHEKLRGGTSRMCIVDEAGFCSELGYVVRSVLLPTVMTTGGKVLLSSTPPKSPDHDFVGFIEETSLKGSMITKTIEDALVDFKTMDHPRITEEIIGQFKSTYPGGENNTEYQREFLCKIITEQENAIIPEFTIDVEADTVVEWPRPLFYNSYVAMDIGFKDLTVALFAYYDFQNQVVVIEDEVVMNGAAMTTDNLAAAIRHKEEQLWTNPTTLEKQEPYMRLSDNNLIMINDLRRLHGLNFLPTGKDDKLTALNNVRIKIANRQIYINPKCKTLITHIRHGTWNKNRTSFNRSADKGHYDACDALIYLIRNIDYNKNPFPVGYGMNIGGDMFYGPKYNRGLETKAQETWGKILNQPKKRKFNK